MSTTKSGQKTTLSVRGVVCTLVPNRSRTKSDTKSAMIKYIKKISMDNKRYFKETLAGMPGTFSEYLLDYDWDSSSIDQKYKICKEWVEYREGTGPNSYYHCMKMYVYEVLNENYTRETYPRNFSEYCEYKKYIFERDTEDIGSECSEDSYIEEEWEECVKNMEDQYKMCQEWEIYWSNNE